ncbi:hypothetical protein PSACC_03339 [Paramicrosporidium saccamoebae]|uniref:Uncharacterized protein n=1 Tax=Paramicrosporidium saccamoebae TaxID=1246581 RepID=A0A2H9TGK8_9FUNG|nr:hypothetical protein PSACC_03339 [Paramicrosporidium saccamoebae]
MHGLSLDAIEPTEEGQLDDLDSVFAETEELPKTLTVDGRGYGTWLPGEASKASSQEHASAIIKDILMRRPPAISPTLPCLEPDLSSLKTDPLDLDPIPEVSSSPKRHKTKPPSGTATPRTSRRPSASTDKPKSTRTPEVAKLQEYFKRMEDVESKEQHSVLEIFIQLLGYNRRVEITDWSFGKDGNYRECQDAQEFQSLVNLVEYSFLYLILKRIQIKAATGNSDSSVLLTHLAQVSALREQSRRLYLRALHYHASATSPLLPLTTFLAEIKKL